MERPDFPRLDHLKRLTAEHGIIQFARGAVPDRSSGFCLDDNVRLLMVADEILHEDRQNAFARNAGEIVWRFIDEAALDAPVYHNMMDEHGRFTDRFASPESIGRLIWALGVVLRDTHVPEWRDRARSHLQRAMMGVPALSSEHARSFAALGWAAAIEAGEHRYVPTLHALAEALHFEFERNAADGWVWRMPELDYDCGRLPQAMLRAGRVLGERQIFRSGERSLQFLASITQSDEMFEPIGAPAWYKRGGERPYYSQQPLEALAMMDAWLAYDDIERAHIAYEWYLGRNRDRLVVADLESGGCHDAIHAPGELNVNMGAESTLAYLQATMILRRLPVVAPVETEALVRR